MNTKRFAQIIFVNLILLLLVGCVGWQNPQELRKIEYLRATDEISLKFLKEYFECVTCISVFDDYEAELFAEYVLSDEYSNYILYLKELLDEQETLNLDYGILFRTEHERHKQFALEELVTIRVYSEILDGRWEENDSITRHDREVQYSELMKIDDIPFLEYLLNADYPEIAWSLMSLQEQISEGSIFLREVEMWEVEKRLNSKSDRIYQKMEIEQDDIMSREMLNYYIHRIEQMGISDGD